MTGKRIFELTMLMAGLLLVGCGSSSGGGDAANAMVFAPAFGDGEGIVINNAAVALDNVPTLRMGDNAADMTNMGFLSFDITGITSASQATLTIYRTSFNNDPGSLGPLQMDHIDVGTHLDVNDALLGTLSIAIHELPDQASWTLDMTPYVQADILAGRSYTSFRVRYMLGTNGNGILDDYRVATSKHLEPALHPRLAITP